MAGMFRAWLGMFKISNSNCTRNRDSHFISLFLSINTTHCLHPSLSVVHTLFLHISFYQCLYLCHSLTPSVFLLITLSLHLSTSVTLSSSDFLLVSHYLQSVLLAVTVSVCLSVTLSFFLSTSGYLQAYETVLNFSDQLCQANIEVCRYELYPTSYSCNISSALLYTPCSLLV